MLLNMMNLVVVKSKMRDFRVECENFVFGRETVHCSVSNL
jgi:hypothetical protein